MKRTVVVPTVVDAALELVASFDVAQIMSSLDDAEARRRYEALVARLVALRDGEAE